MNRYLVDEVVWDDERLIELGDRRTGARARIWTRFGCNCVDLRLAAPAPSDGAVPDSTDQATELIVPPLQPEDLRSSPARWGTPLLFPWPGRIPCGEYVWKGRRFTLPDVDATGNAIHGLVNDRPWRIDQILADDNGARLCCSISASDCPEAALAYPFDWTLRTTYRLLADELELRVEVHNLGSEGMPFGFGTHPYFSVPFAPHGRREECRVQVPASGKWDLDRLRQLSPGDKGGTNGTSGSLVLPLASHEDLTRPTPLGTGSRDAALTGLEMIDGYSVSTLSDPAAGLTLAVRASAGFETLVLFAPADRSAFCIEPWTCPPNVFNAVSSGHNDVGLLVLEPRSKWHGTVSYKLQQAEE